MNLNEFPLFEYLEIDMCGAIADFSAVSNSSPSATELSSTSRESVTSVHQYNKQYETFSFFGDNTINLAHGRIFSLISLQSESDLEA